jgi:hypothetical protein
MLFHITPTIASYRRQSLYLGKDDEPTGTMVSKRGFAHTGYNRMGQNHSHSIVPGGFEVTS